MARHRARGASGSIVLAVVVVLLFVQSGPGDRGQTNDRDGPVAARAVVTRVIDGDTIEVRLGGRRDEVRYIGVDTPETVAPGTPVQCFGLRASHFNRRLTAGQTVRLVLGVERRDDYGRLLAYVHVGNRFLNALLLRRGLARSLTIRPNDRFAPLFRRLERRAAIAGRGLWGSCPP